MAVNIHKCFIASPKDTQMERLACDEVFSEINQTLGESLGFRIETIKWERDARPSFGDDGQSVINDQLKPGEHDFFVGIMWKHFGTATPRAGSGTEEEFDRAYSCWEKNKTKKIQFYFNNETPEHLTDCDADELAKVQRFKKKVSDKGGLYSDYKGIESFKSQLRKNITKELLELYKIDGWTARAPDWHENMTQYYTAQFHEAMCAFGDEPADWVAPRISTKSETDSLVSSATFVDTKELLTSKSSFVVKAPPQFGLTCLSLFIALELLKEGKAYLRIDCREVSHHRQALQKAAKRSCPFKEKTDDWFDGIILDSWNRREQNNVKYLSNLCDLFPDQRIIIMETADYFGRQMPVDISDCGLELSEYFMWSLSRNKIRSVVSCYNQRSPIGADDIVLIRIIDDMERLNLHRTPLNCLTLLKASEGSFDEDPVNRAEVIHRILFILFNMGTVPSYKARPDLKDCEYVLGYFCEELLTQKRNTFSRDFFLSEIQEFCEEMLITINIEVVFDVLHENHILVPCGNEFRFRFRYWVLYFAAHRMHHNEGFKKHVFEDLRYANFPEIIEFYTGIDRKRNDAVEVLASDLETLIQYVDEKCGFPKEFAPYEHLCWEPREELLTKMHEDISTGVNNSSLPDTVKDEFADRTYSPTRAYQQDVTEALQGMSYVCMCNTLTASATALRNSDFISPALKKRMLQLIVDAWWQISRVLLLIAPVLAHRGWASYDGKSYTLCGDFGDTPEERFRAVLCCIPMNIVQWSQQDLFSNKMTVLIYAVLKNVDKSLCRHMIALLLICKRPDGWRNQIEKHIGRVHKNSYSLLDIYGALSREYEYGFCSPKELADLSDLIKMTGMKHLYGIKKPGSKKIKKAPDNWVPERHEDETSEG